MKILRLNNQRESGMTYNKKSLIVTKDLQVVRKFLQVCFCLFFHTDSPSTKMLFCKHNLLHNTLPYTHSWYAHFTYTSHSYFHSCLCTRETSLTADILGAGRDLLSASFTHSLGMISAPKPVVTILLGIRDDFLLFHKLTKHLLSVRFCSQHGKLLKTSTLYSPFIFLSEQ